MKFFSSTHPYPYEWANVSLAYWQKYPNPFTRHVRHVEVLDRRLDVETGVLRTERLIVVSQPLPGLFRKLLGTDDESYALEISETDPKSRTLRARSINLTLSHLLRAEETLTYRPNPENPSETLFEQEATVTAGGAMSRVAGYVEEFSLKRFHQNAAIGRMGFEQVLERLCREGQELAAAASATTTL